MGIADVVGIIVGMATIYFLWRANQLSKEQNQIFRDQNAIFANQEGGALAPSVISPIIGFKRYWPMIGMATLAVLTWSAVGYDMYDRHHASQGLSAEIQGTVTGKIGVGSNSAPRMAILAIV